MLRLSRTVVLVILTTSLTGLLVGYDLSIAESIFKGIRDDFHFCQKRKDLCHEMSWFIAIAAPGAAVGSLGAGYFSDAFGRRKLLMLVDILFVIGSILIAAGKSFFLLLAGRVVLGCAIGAGFVLFGTYIPEISPQDRRGQLVAFQDCVLSIGFLLGLGVMALVKESYWRFSIGIVGVIAGIQFCLVPLLPESPSWLVQKGNLEEALQSVLRLTYKSGNDSEYGTDATPEGASELQERHVLRCRETVVAMSAHHQKVLARKRHVWSELAREEPFEKSSHKTSEETTASSPTIPTKALHLSGTTEMVPQEPDKPIPGASVVPMKSIRTLEKSPSTTESLTSVVAPLKPQNNSISLPSEAVEKPFAHQPTTFAVPEPSNSNHALNACSQSRRGWASRRLQSIALFLAYWKPICVAVGCAVAQNATFGNTVIYYSKSILQDIGGVGSIVHHVTVGVGLAKFLGILSATLCVEKIGRRFLLFWGSFITLACHIAFAILAGFIIPTKDTNGASSPSGQSGTSAGTWIFLGIMYLFIYAWNISWAGLMFVVASEVLPHPVRGMGMGLTIAVFWLLSFCLQVTVGRIFAAFTAPGAFGFFAACNVFTLLFVILCIKDLTGVACDEAESLDDTV